MRWARVFVCSCGRARELRDAHAFKMISQANARVRALVREGALSSKWSPVRICLRVKANPHPK
eukprot:6214298-Pleurochrysis_carterae.AAC.3